MRMLLLSGVCLFSAVAVTTAHAGICDVSALTEPTVAGRNFQITLSGPRELTVIGGADIGNGERPKIDAFLEDVGTPKDKLLADVRAFLERHQAERAAVEGDLAYLTSALTAKKADFVAIESSPENLQAWLDSTARLYFDEWSVVLRRDLPDADMRALVELAVGAPLYLHQDKAELFANVRLAGIGDSDDGERLLALMKKAARELASARRALRYSPRTRRAFERLVGKMSADYTLYTDLSKARVRAAQLPYFQKRSRAAIGAWLDAEMDARLELRRHHDRMAERLLVLEGRGLFFVRRVHLVGLGKSLMRACRAAGGAK